MGCWVSQCYDNRCDCATDYLSLDLSHTVTLDGTAEIASQRFTVYDEIWHKVERDKRCQPGAWSADGPTHVDPNPVTMDV